MQILAHRGWWTDPAEKNSEAAFHRAFAANFGIETDVRDLNGNLVISHDPATRGAMTLDAFLDLYLAYSSRPCLALNVKADGLAQSLQEKLSALEISNYFVFDMSVPDSLHYLHRDMPVLTRLSEYEAGSPLDQSAAGVWLDSFTGADDRSMMARAVRETKRTAIVSPELHGRPHLPIWNAWLADVGMSDERIALCTDFPDHADKLFNTRPGGAEAY